MSKYQYRVEEKNGEFFIQAALEQTKGILWWKKKVIEWRPADRNGVPCFYVLMRFLEINTYKDRLPPFKSLDDAESKIKQFVWPEIKHHYPFGKPDLLPHFKHTPPPPKPKHL